MDTLDQSRIENGKRLLLISVGLLAVMRLVLAILLQDIVANTVSFDQFDEVYWLMVPALLLMGAAIYRGGKPARYILCGLLVIAVVLEIYLFTLAGFPDTLFMITSIVAWIATGFVLYVVMINDQTEEFFLYQRSRNFGEYAVVNNASRTQPPAQKKAKAEKPAHDPLDDEPLVDILDDQPEEAPSTPNDKQKKSKKQDWGDELDLFE